MITAGTFKTHWDITCSGASCHDVHVQQEVTKSKQNRYALCVICPDDVQSGYYTKGFSPRAMLAVSPLQNSGQRALDRCSTPCMRPNEVKLAVSCSGTMHNLLMRQERKPAVSIALSLSLLSAVTKAAKPPVHQIKHIGLAQKRWECQKILCMHVTGVMQQ